MEIYHSVLRRKNRNHKKVKKLVMDLFYLPGVSKYFGNTCMSWLPSSFQGNKVWEIYYNGIFPMLLQNGSVTKFHLGHLSNSLFHLYRGD